MPAASETTDARPTVRLQVDIDAENARRIRALSILNGRRMQDEVDEAISQYLVTHMPVMPAGSRA